MSVKENRQAGIYRWSQYRGWERFSSVEAKMETDAKWNKRTTVLSVTLGCLGGLIIGGLIALCIWGATAPPQKMNRGPQNKSGEVQRCHNRSSETNKGY